MAVNRTPEGQPVFHKTEEKKGVFFDTSSRRLQTGAENLVEKFDLVSTVLPSLQHHYPNNFGSFCAVSWPAGRLHCFVFSPWSTSIDIPVLKPTN